MVAEGKCAAAVGLQDIRCHCGLAVNGARIPWKLQADDEAEVVRVFKAGRRRSCMFEIRIPVIAQPDAARAKIRKVLGCFRLATSHHEELLQQVQFTRQLQVRDVSISRNANAQMRRDLQAAKLRQEEPGLWWLRVIAFKKHRDPDRLPAVLDALVGSVDWAAWHFQRHRTAALFLWYPG